MAILPVLLIIVGTIMMAMSQKAGAMAAQVRKGTIHAVLCQNLMPEAINLLLRLTWKPPGALTV